MKLKFNEFLAVVYGDIFDYPLIQDEARLWSVSGDFHKFVTNYHEYEKHIDTRAGFYFLKGKGKLVKVRQEREKFSEIKKIKAVEAVNLLKVFPTVEAIFLTGSAAAGNAKEESDVDLMIVTKSGTLWMTRLLVVGALKMLGRYRSRQEYTDRICTNIFLDTEHLEIKEKNLYTAHEVLLAKCLFDRAGMEEKWLKENLWTKDYLLEAYKNQVFRIKNHGEIGDYKFSKYMILNTLFLLPEWLAFRLQYFYMKNRITNERVGPGFAFFHPRDLSAEIIKKFESKLRPFKV